MSRDWELKAACRTVDPELFFTEAASADARMVCGGCPVREECLEAVLVREQRVSRDSRTGVFAGLSGWQRWQIWQDRMAAEGEQSTARAGGPGRKPAPCGTKGAYERHRKAGEPIDGACRAAATASQQRYRQTGSTRAPAR